MSLGLLVGKEKDKIDIQIQVNGNKGYITCPCVHPQKKLIEEMIVGTLLADMWYIYPSERHNIDLLYGDECSEEGKEWTNIMHQYVGFLNYADGLAEHPHESAFVLGRNAFNSTLLKSFTPDPTKLKLAYSGGKESKLLEHCFDIKEEDKIAVGSDLPPYGLVPKALFRVLDLYPDMGYPTSDYSKAMNRHFPKMWHKNWPPSCEYFAWRLLLVAQCPDKYTLILTGDESDTHDLYKTRDGLLGFGVDFPQSQFGNNLINSFLPLGGLLYSPLSKYTAFELFCMANEAKLEFTSCFNHSKEKKWCNNCLKCLHIDLLYKVFSDYTKPEGLGFDYLTVQEKESVPPEMLMCGRTVSDFLYATLMPRENRWRAEAKYLHAVLNNHSGRPMINIVKHRDEIDLYHPKLKGNETLFKQYKLAKEANPLIQ